MRGNVPKSKFSEIYAHVPRERQTRFVHSSQDGTLFEKTARLIGNVRSSTDRATVIESKDTRFGNDSTNFADKNVDAKGWSEIERRKGWKNYPCFGPRVPRVSSFLFRQLKRARDRTPRRVTWNFSDIGSSFSIKETVTASTTTIFPTFSNNGNF